MNMQFTIKKKTILVSRKYYRPLEVDTLLGNFNKAKKDLKWKPKYNFNRLVDDMIEYEKKLIMNEYK